MTVSDKLQCALSRRWDHATAIQTPVVEVFVITGIIAF
jgi:hypothetical protein